MQASHVSPTNEPGSQNRSPSQFGHCAGGSQIYSDQQHYLPGRQINTHPYHPPGSQIIPPPSAYSPMHITSAHDNAANANNPTRGSSMTSAPAPERFPPQQPAGPVNSHGSVPGYGGIAAFAPSMAIAPSTAFAPSTAIAPSTAFAPSMAIAPSTAFAHSNQLPYATGNTNPYRADPAPGGYSMFLQRAPQMTGPFAAGYEYSAALEKLSATNAELVKELIRLNNVVFELTNAKRN